MQYVTIKVHENTRTLLRIIAAVTGEQMVQVLDRLCQAEIERVIATLPKNAMITIHGQKREGKSYVIDQLAERTNNSAADTEGDGSASDTGDGESLAGDDAI